MNVPLDCINHKTPDKPTLRTCTQDSVSIHMQAEAADGKPVAVKALSLVGGEVGSCFHADCLMEQLL